jgi:hypothetical protein
MHQLRHCGAPGEQVAVIQGASKTETEAAATIVVDFAARAAIASHGTAHCRRQCDLLLAAVAERGRLSGLPNRPPQLHRPDVVHKWPAFYPGHSVSFSLIKNDLMSFAVRNGRRFAFVSGLRKAHPFLN